MIICLEHLKGNLEKFNKIKQQNQEWLDNEKNQSEKYNLYSQIESINKLIDDYTQAVETIEKSLK